jgi:hypothetical protein
MITQNIAPDAHTGTWTRRGIPAGHRVDTFTAAELAAMFGQEFVIWESAGQSQQADGSLAGYDSTGRLVIIHPAARNLRILTK